jgi:integrase
MSENTIMTALKTLGYDSEIMTAHGFRTTASTLLNEQGWSPDAIERQLSHAHRDKIRAVYNRAQYLDERRHDAILGGLSGYTEKRQKRRYNTDP